MIKIAELLVSPTMGQVSIGYPDDKDYPQWESGDETAVSNGLTVAIATHAESEGAVRIEVWDAVVDYLDSDVVYEGCFRQPGRKFVVGSVLSAELYSLEFQEDVQEIRVHATTRYNPDCLSIVLLRNE